jgi:hypothetical protein
MYILVYIDDIIVASSSSEATSALLKSLEEDFALKDLGNLHYFMGIEVTRSQQGILLTQGKYAMDLLKRPCMSNGSRSTHLCQSRISYQLMSESP